MTDTQSKQVSLRTRRVDSSDPRVLKTRQKLIDSYHRLLDAGGVTDITVTALVQDSGVTRSSFYAHFSGVGDLAATALTDFSENIIAGARTAILEGGSKTAVNEGVVRDLVRFIADRRDTYGALLVSDPDFAAAFHDGMVESMRTTLRGRTTLLADPEITARYVSGGMLAAFQWWLTDPGAPSRDDLARALMAIAPPDFRD